MTVIDFQPATDRMAEVLKGVPDDSFAAPTPSGYTVGDLLDHIRGLTLAFTLAAKKQTPPGLEGGRPVPDVALLPDDWRTSIPEHMADLAEAWRDPAAWEGMTKAGGIEMPGEFCGVVALEEIVLHAWDLAKATGQDYDPDPADLGPIHGMVTQFAAPGMEAMREGVYGPIVPVPEDAPLFDQILGLAGRDPYWTPGT